MYSLMYARLRSLVCGMATAYQGLTWVSMNYRLRHGIVTTRVALTSTGLPSTWVLIAGGSPYYSYGTVARYDWLTQRALCPVVVDITLLLGLGLRPIPGVL